MLLKLFFIWLAVPYFFEQKNHKVQITDFEFISNAFIVSDGQEFCLSVDILSPKKTIH